MIRVFWNGMVIEMGWMRYEIILCRGRGDGKGPRRGVEVKSRC
jgi:hypothetical protein